MDASPWNTQSSIVVRAGSIALATILATATHARAEVFASPVVYFSWANQRVCYLSNVGPGDIGVLNPRIVNEKQTSIALTLNSCGSSLASGRTCVWMVNYPSEFYSQCRVDLSSKANARGSFDLRQLGSDPTIPAVKFSLEMR